jgi:hypothetical protein
MEFPCFLLSKWIPAWSGLCSEVAMFLKAYNLVISELCCLIALALWAEIFECDIALIKIATVQICRMFVLAMLDTNQSSNRVYWVYNMHL